MPHKNPNLKAACARDYYLRHKAELNSYRRQWARDNPEKESRYKSNWLKLNLQWMYQWESERNPLIRKAYIKVRNAIKSGVLIRLPCKVCGDKKSHAHHEDYAKPLDVIWLCPKHHKEEHQKMKTATLTAQQGDICLRRLASIPGGKSSVISRVKCVLADGEATGHQHVVDESDAELIAIGDRIILRIEHASTVIHPEHAPIRLAPGIWEVGRVKEYDYFQQMARQVID